MDSPDSSVRLVRHADGVTRRRILTVRGCLSRFRSYSSVTAANRKWYSRAVPMWWAWFVDGLRLAEEKICKSYTVYHGARWIYGECEEIGWTIVRYSAQTWVEKISDPQNVRRRRCFSNATDSIAAAPHKYFGGGGVDHFRLAAALGFGGCGSIVGLHDRAVAATGRSSTLLVIEIDR